MAYDNGLAVRIREILTGKKNIEEKKMFGGVAFLLKDHILVGAWKQYLIVRLGPDQGKAALLEPHVKEFDITGQPMKGWAMVEPAGVEDDELLHDWIERASKFVKALPAKRASKS